LSAIQKGFRARVDVKGKLADYFLNKQIERHIEAGDIQNCIWQDKDGQPDFVITYCGKTFKIECKNVRSKELFSDPPSYKVEIQKTRNAIGGGPTRGYRVGQFDILAACLFNHTRVWSYLYAVTSTLRRRDDAPDFLMIMQPVPKVATPPWHDSLINALREASKLRRKS
ncbi:MAG: hypothetical protein ACT4OO_04240, partial [Nitrospiraceae bacterium]